MADLTVIPSASQASVQSIWTNADGNDASKGSQVPSENCDDRDPEEVAEPNLSSEERAKQLVLFI